MTALAVWSFVVHPGKKEVFHPAVDVRVTNASLGDKLTDENGRTSIKLTYMKPEGEEEKREKATTVLCSLSAGKIEQSTLDLVLSSEEEYVFELAGKNVIHLTGNYIDQEGPDQDPYGSDDSDDEEDFDLREVSSDVEINPDELDVPSDNDERFEEVTETVTTTSKKRALEEDDSMDVDGQLSKSQRKKLAKKQKVEGGKAVPTEVTESASVTPSPAKADGEKKKKEKKDKKPTATGGETKELPGGLKVKDTKKGAGPEAKKGQRVSMRYIGKLGNDKGKEFDSNVKGPPFVFRIGKSEVIQGWDLGIPGMQVGGERTIVVPPNLGYGSKKLPGIPPNSTLHFEVKLVEIK